MCLGIGVAKGGAGKKKNKVVEVVEIRTMFFGLSERMNGGGERGRERRMEKGEKNEDEEEEED